jgi:DNA-binding NtrC family response regulator
LLAEVHPDLTLHPARLRADAESDVHALARPHRHSLSHALIVGGSAPLRERVARALHAESSHAIGPFVMLRCDADEPRLRLALDRWLTRTGRGSAVNPLWPAERGTLYLESVGSLAMETQAQLLNFAATDFALSSERGNPRAGRLVVGSDQDLWDLVAADRFLGRLADVLDKIRVELDPRIRGGAA